MVWYYLCRSTMSMNIPWIGSRRLKLLGFLVLLFAAGKISLDLWERLLLESHGYLNGDALIYLTVGRGLLNGLQLYTDIFESKPPGLMYLFAASQFFGGTLLARIIQAITLLSLPFGLTAFAWVHGRRDFHGSVLLLSSFIVGCLLAFLSAVYAGGLKAEIFGLLPAVLYVLNIRSRNRLSLNVIFILWVVMFREPYILAMLAAAIISSRTGREFWHTIVYPTLIAGAVALILLSIVGLLGPYVRFYLPAIFFGRIEATGTEPLFLRVFWVSRLLSSLTTFSLMPTFGYVIFILWVYAIVIKEKLTRETTILTIIGVVLGVLIINEFFNVLPLTVYKASAYGLGLQYVLSHRLFLPTAVPFFIRSLFYLCFLYYLWKKSPHALMYLVSGLLTLPLLNIAISIGGYSRQYVLFSLPVIVVVFLMYLQKPQKYLSVGLGIVLCSIPFIHKAAEYNTPLYEYWKNAKATSLQLDQLMDACGFATYIDPGSSSSFAFARHSPIGPLFGLNSHPYLGFDHPLYQQTFKNMSEVNLLVTQYPSFTGMNLLPAEIRQQFTSSAPPCANGHHISGFVALYRH